MTFEEERAAARRKNAAATNARKRAEARTRSTSITWLPKPTYIGGVRVWGVAADAADDVKVLYL